MRKDAMKMQYGNYSVWNVQSFTCSFVWTYGLSGYLKTMFPASCLTFGKLVKCGSVPDYYLLILHCEILYIWTINTTASNIMYQTEDFSFNYLIFQAQLKHINLMAVTDGESWMTLKLISWTLCISLNKQIQVRGQRQRHTDKGKTRQWKTECCLGHLLDLRCCDLVWLQLNPGGDFRVNLWSLSRRCLSDLYLSLQPMGNGDDFHDNGLDSMLFLACSSPSSA